MKFSKMHVLYTRAYSLKALYFGETFFKTLEFFVEANLVEVAICEKCQVKILK
jgi:hypothetical protein